MGKTGSIGQTIDGLRIAVAVQWNKYPMHLTRQLTVTVGALRVVDESWCEDSRDIALMKLEAILSGCEPELMADFRRFLGEVGL
jgi:hypothetical protein